MSKSDIERLFERINVGDMIDLGYWSKPARVLYKEKTLLKRTCSCVLSDCTLIETEYFSDILDDLSSWKLNGKPLTLGPPPKRTSGFGKWVRDNAL